MQFDGTSATHRHFVTLCLRVFSVEACIYCSRLGHQFGAMCTMRTKSHSNPKAPSPSTTFSCRWCSSICLLPKRLQVPLDLHICRPLYIKSCENGAIHDTSILVDGDRGPQRVNMNWSGSHKNTRLTAPHRLDLGLTDCSCNGY
jgi:hypothetical protein